MSHSRLRFIVKEVAGRCLEELQSCRILPGRGVGYIDEHRNTLERIRESLACQAVDAGRGGRGYYFLPLLTKLIDKLRSNESSTANYYDFHGYLSCLTDAILSCLLLLTGPNSPRFDTVIC